MSTENNTIAKCRVLIIDDEESIRITLESVLFRAGYVPSTAANCKVALQRILGGHKVDIILCDLKTPVMSGVEFIGEVRKAGITTPIVILSGNVDREAILAIRQLGVASIIVKPTRPLEIVEIIKNILSAQQLDEKAS